MSSGKRRRHFNSKHGHNGSLTLEEVLDETSRNLADATQGMVQDSMCVVLELVQKVYFSVHVVLSL